VGINAGEHRGSTGKGDGRPGSGVDVGREAGSGSRQALRGREQISASKVGTMLCMHGKRPLDWCVPFFVLKNRRKKKIT
jgi:hypothetical protein